MKPIFRKVSDKVSQAAGSAATFSLALLVVLVWAVSGPLFDYSAGWQLVINTGTTIVTFLMIFLVQNTQNRDGRAVQLKLDELIRATKARDAFVDLEELNDEELAELNREFQDLHEKEATSPVMKKLHATLQIEHERRKTIGKSATRINELLHKKI